MEFSSSNIKKILIFSQKKAFLIFLEIEPYTFQSQLKKIKLCPEKISCIPGNRNPPKNYYVFSKESFCYISRNGNPEEELPKGEGTSKAPKPKIYYTSPKQL